MFGQTKLEQFKALTSMPQKAATAWDSAFPPDFIGVEYKPLLYLGEQLTNDLLFWFIAERYQPYRFEIRNVVKLALFEEDGKYKIANEFVIA